MTSSVSFILSKKWRFHLLSRFFVARGCFIFSQEVVSYSQSRLLLSIPIPWKKKRSVDPVPIPWREWFTTVSESYRSENFWRVTSCEENFSLAHFDSLFQSSRSQSCIRILFHTPRQVWRTETLIHRLERRRSHECRRGRFHFFRKYRHWHYHETKSYGWQVESSSGMWTDWSWMGLYCWWQC